MSIIPSAQAVADWVLSQSQQGIGPDLRISTMPSIVGKDTFTKTFKSGIFQLWISNNSHLIMQAEFAPHFEATSDELSQMWGEKVSMQDQTVDFLGQVSFSNYNQPVSIQVPPEALNAK